jgi:hypothetical protein
MQTIDIINSFDFDENNKIIGNHVPVILEKLKGPKSGVAMKFASYLIEQVKERGKESALEVKTPFNEIEVIESNTHFIYENLN